MLLRICLGILLALTIAQPARADDAADRIRFGFFPPMDEDIVYRVDYRSEQTLAGTPRVVNWSHEVHMRIGAKEEPDIHSGTFSLRAVKAKEGADNDLTYIVARALENETFAFKLVAGVPYEVDWPAIRARLEPRLPQVAHPEMAKMIASVMPTLEAAGANAVLRPFWATGIGYLRAFKRDGSVETVENMDLPSWFQIPGSTLSTYGGNEEGTEDMLMMWRLVPPPQAASRKLGPEIRQITAALTSAPERAKAKPMLEKLLAGEIEALEGGIATFDRTPGLMRRLQLDVRLIIGDFRRDTNIVITRLAPE
jgi:hypothetical protein